jgi:hypothetical protein
MANLDALAVGQRDADVAEPDVGCRHLEESRQELRLARWPRLAALQHDLDPCGLELVELDDAGRSRA